VAFVVDAGQSWFHPVSLAEVAEALAAAGDSVGVEKLLDRLEWFAASGNPLYARKIILRVAKVRVLLGNPGEAEDLVLSVFGHLHLEDVRSLRNDVALLLSQVLTDVGDHERALRVVREALFDEDRVAALATMSEALAVAGRHDRAMQLVDEVLEGPRAFGSWAWRVAAERMASASFIAGRYDKAATAVQSVDGPEDRCRALMRLAHAPVAPEHATQALRFAAQALRSEHWSTALDDLAAVSLPTLLAVAEEFTALAD
jgi:tetratricopeptide (TPR) repeat protein